MSEYIVVKLGGHALENPIDWEQSLDSLASGLTALLNDGTSPVLVHGAGPQISNLMNELGIATSFLDGLRVTDEKSMDVAAMALSLVNLQLVCGLQRRGVRAVGLAGPDDNLLTGSPLGEKWGRVAGTIHVRDALIRRVSESGAVAVVNPVATDENGQLINCNADAVAGAITASLKASVLVLLSDVDQLRRDPDDPATSIQSVTREDVARMMDSGAIRDGMRPKMTAALSAIEAGATRVVIANGTRANALNDAVHQRGRFTEISA